MVVEKWFSNKMKVTQKLDELVKLEIRNDIANILRTNPIIFPADGTMMLWIVDIMLEAQSSQQAIKSWRSIAKKNERNIHIDFSDAQKSILELSDAAITALFTKIKAYLSTNALAVKDTMIERINAPKGHSWNDKYELNQKPKRSLDILRKKGMHIKISKPDIQMIRENYVDEDNCPVIDQIKNKKIANINGFTQSKISLIIHDFFDHFWIYDLLESSGILQRYSEFLQSVGNPQNTDMFSREGELIASVGFEWRSSHTPERDFKPLFSFSQIQDILHTNSNNISQNQRIAKEILKKIDAEEIKRLCSICSGVFIELMEQKRVHGFIRKLDKNYTAIGLQSFYDPEYIALIIEVTHILCNPKTKAREQLFKTEITIEDYLTSLIRGESEDDLLITLKDVQSFDPKNSRVNEKRQKWLLDNPFHTATRLDRC